MKAILQIASLVAMSAMLMGGCKALDTVDTHEQAVHSAINIATLAAIEHTADRAATAQKVIAAANEAKQLLDFDSVTLQQLAQRARARVALSDSEMSYKAALNTLIDLAEAQITSGIKDGTLTLEQKVTVNKVLDWIIQSAQAYVG